MTIIERAESDVNQYLTGELGVWFENLASDLGHPDSMFGYRFQRKYFLKSLRIDKDGEAYVKVADEDGETFREYVPESLQEIAQIIAK